MRTAVKNALKKELFALTKLEVVNYLKGVSNQNAEVPIEGENYFSIRDLIIEVEAETMIGIKYMIGWMKATSVVSEIRRKK